MKMSAEFIDFIAQYNTPIDFIENLFLKSLIDSYSRIKNIENISNISENKIRDEFQYDLKYSNELIKDKIKNNFLTFTVENQIINEKKEIMRTDIQFIINGYIIYVIECKKLKGISKTQYIDNGISRFIKPNKYVGKNNKYAGMCSFVVDINIDKVIVGIKKIIREYHFREIEENKICGFRNSFSSKHTKLDKKYIFIHHLFFKM